MSLGASTGTPADVFDRFSDGCRQALVLAADEARSLGHDRIGTEHLLLGLVRLGDEATAGLDLTIAAARQDVRSMLGTGTRRTPGELRFTPTAKRALDRANAQTGDGGATQPAQLLAALLGEKSSGAAELLATGPDDDGRLLLELASREESVTARALRTLGIDHARLRRAVEEVRRR